MDIKVGFNKEEPMSFEQAANLVDEKNSRSEVELRRWADSVPSVINITPSKDTVRFLEYAISLCDGKKPIYSSLLRLKIHLSTMPDFVNMSKADMNRFIAQCLTKTLKQVIKPEQVNRYEREAILYIQEAIRRTINHKIPLVGNF